MLGHRSLTEDFSSEDEFCVEGVHVFFGFFEHEYSAVDAGVHVAAVTVFWVLYHVEVGFTSRDYFKGYVELCGDAACFVLAAFSCACAEGGDEVDDCDIDVLFKHYFNGEGAIQST